MKKNLVIVESPAKAKTIQRFLGSDFSVISSYGHIRDLPKSKMGVDVEKDFTPQYVIPMHARKRVTAIKKATAKAENLYFATDEDREGEAIAWHLVQILKPSPEKIKRITFDEITEKAIQSALKNPREIDQDLVDAQQARRILDRLVGYELSPFLWKKIRRGLSAGRVQSVAVRLIVEREREIEAFKPQEYWTIEAQLATKNKEKFWVTLKKISGKALGKFGITKKEEAQKIVQDLKEAKYEVSNIKKEKVERSPLPPFTTATLQQEASRHLGFSAKRTMIVAQQLYEGVEIGKEGLTGLITYMRTDSLHLSQEALKKAKEVLISKFGKEYALPSPRIFKSKSKTAQEAHEAIRPTYLEKDPQGIRHYLTPEQLKLYSLIWARTLACQASPAILENTTYDISAKKYLFRAIGATIQFPGFLKIYGQYYQVKQTLLPKLSEKEILYLEELKPVQHFTEPPARYSEAGLIKALESYDIGRPSTYAPTIATIQERQYVEKGADKRFRPTEIGILVNDLLVEHFPQVVDIKFTSHMEDDLDKIARGEMKWVPVLKEFYQPFHSNLLKKEKEVSKEKLTTKKTELICEKCGAPVVEKIGRFGKFLACSRYPECKNTKPLGEEAKLHEEHTGIKCEKCGAEMVVKRGRFGAFLGCSRYPECKNIQRIEKKLGVTCPQCKKGEIVEKKGKKNGRVFFACNRYPDCDFVLWQRPTGEFCPKCKKLLVYAGKNKIKCSNKECDFTPTPISTKN